MKLYRSLRWLVRLACQVFFRRIEVVGRDEVPRVGAVIFCGNHPNSLLDPILITAFCGRVVHFAAKDTLFDSPLVGTLLRKLGAVPIRRRVDHQHGALDNQGAFEALVEVLGQGRAAGIFPEGLSHDEAQLAPLKTGAVRIAAAVKRRWPELPVYLVPTGLNYFTRNRFRSSVLIQFGAALAVPASVVGLDDDADRAMTAELTARLDVHLRGLTINADSWDTIRVLDGVRRLYQPEAISLEDRAWLSRRFNEVYPTVAREPEVVALIARVRAYQFRLSAIGVSDGLVRRGLSVRGSIARAIGHLVLIGFWGPLFLIGAPLHAPLGLLFKIVGNHFAPRKDVVATTKFLLGLFGILVTYAGLAGAAGLGLGWRWGLLAVFVLPLSGHAFIHVIARVDALRHLVLTTGRVLIMRRELAALRVLRGELEAEVVAAVDRLRPADLVPRFARPVAP